MHGLAESHTRLWSLAMHGLAESHTRLWSLAMHGRVILAISHTLYKACICIHDVHWVGCSQMGYFKACQEIMNSGFQQLLTNLNGDIQRLV